MSQSRSCCSGAGRLVSLHTALQRLRQPPITHVTAYTLLLGYNSFIYCGKSRCFSYTESFSPDTVPCHVMGQVERRVTLVCALRSCSDIHTCRNWMYLRDGERNLLIVSTQKLVSGRHVRYWPIQPLSWSSTHDLSSENKRSPYYTPQTVRRKKLKIWK